MIDEVQAKGAVQDPYEAVKAATAHCTIEITMEEKGYFFRIFDNENGVIYQWNYSNTAIVPASRSIEENFRYYNNLGCDVLWNKDQRDYFRQKLRTCIKEKTERTCFYLDDYEKPVKIEVFVKVGAKND